MLHTVLAWLTFNDSSKLKLAKLAFLYSEEFVKNLNGFQIIQNLAKSLGLKVGKTCLQ